MSEYRYYLKRAVGDLWLDTNASLGNVTMVDALSATGVLTAKIPAGLVPTVNAEDGRPVWGRWDTILIAESDDHMWGGVCVNAAPDDGGGLAVMVIGCTGWWQKVPYLGEYSVWKRDAGLVVEELFTQAMKDAPTKLPIRLRIPGGKLDRTVGDDQPTKEPEAPVREKDQPMADYYDTPAYNAYQKNKEEWDLQYGDNKPYSLGWWEAPMLGEEIDSLANEIGFDYRERIKWRDRGQLDFRFIVDIEAEMRRRRHDIEFVDGINIALPLKVRDDEQIFANHVIGLGAGEGRDMVRAEARSNNKRLYQAEYLPLKDIRNKDRLKAMIESYLKIVGGTDAQVDQVVVWDSPGFSPVGTLRCGDEVRVRSDFTTPRVDLWRRILRIERTPGTNKMTLSLEKANG